MNALHFISGLPRSGSTLLAGLLRQNPRFHAAMTSPVGPMVQALLATFTPQNETAVFLDDVRRQAILCAAIEAYYQPQADKDVRFDTNRLWCAQLPLLRALYPHAKVLCCVRDIAWIMDSFERLVRRNAFEPSRLFANNDERATVYSRTETLERRDRVVGFAHSALKEAYYGEQSDALLIIEYDLLTRQPLDCLKLIYGFLEQPWFAHDVDHVDYDEPEFDRQLGAPGLHTVSGPVRVNQRQTILPPDIIGKYQNLAFWRDPKGTKAFRITQTATTNPA
ncbi:MAG: sulfotransferase [Geminicoccaceae bacterium]